VSAAGSDGFDIYDKPDPILSVLEYTDTFLAAILGFFLLPSIGGKTKS
jgi:hypothetical protein